MRKTCSILAILLLMFPPSLSSTTYLNLSAYDHTINTNSCFNQALVNKTTTKEWTFMAYLNGDSDLEEEMLNSLNKMELVGSNSHLNIIVNIDDLHIWGGETRRYYVQHDTDLNTIQSKLADDNTSEKNMGDPQTLTDFVCWATDTYPAQHYCLIIAGHGNGWTGVLADHSYPYDTLTMIEIKNAMQTITSHMKTKIDILSFNACSMGMIEVFYQIKECINIGIASEDLQHSGYPYHQFLSKLRDNPTLSPHQFSKEIVTTSFNSNVVFDISAFKIETLQQVANDINIVATKLKQKLPFWFYLIASSIRRCLSFINYFDLYDFIQEIKKHFFFDDNINAAAQQALDTINASIIASQSKKYHNNKICHGYSIYLEHREGYYTPKYENLDFAHDTQWDELICSYLEASSKMMIQTK